MAIEYLRPTADVDSSGVGPYDSGTHVATTSQSVVYSGKSGVGPTGSSGIISVSPGGAYQGYSQRIFKTFQTPTRTYTDLTINVSADYSLVGSTTGVGHFVYYSINGGSSWITMAALTTSQATLTTDITGATVSQIQVIIEVQSSSVLTKPYSLVTVGIFDIWTAGTYSAVTRHATAYLL